MEENCIELSDVNMLALRDALEVLGGKWKFCILMCLYYNGEMRFKDFQEAISRITPKVLSKELQDLEQNLLVTRTVKNTKPVTVGYALTEHAKETQAVIMALINFGEKHRQKILAK